MLWIREIVNNDNDDNNFYFTSWKSVQLKLIFCFEILGILNHLYVLLKTILNSLVEALLFLRNTNLSIDDLDFIKIWFNISVK